MISISVRLPHQRLSYFTGYLRCSRPRIHARIPLSSDASLNRIIASVPNQPFALRPSCLARPGRGDDSGDEKAKRAASTVVCGVQVGINSAVCGPIRRSRPLFDAQTGCSAVGPAGGSRRLSPFSLHGVRRPNRPLSAPRCFCPPLDPTVSEGLVQAVFRRSIAPSRPVPTDAR